MSKLVVYGMLLCVFGGTAVAEEIKVEGGGAAIASVFMPMKEAFEKATGISLMVAQSTPVKGLIALERGSVDVATAAVPLEVMINGAAKEGVLIDSAFLYSQEVEKNRVMVFVHQSNKVPVLSKEQLKGIFTGKITNWKAVGGENRNIVVVWGNKTPGQNGLFTNAILDGESVLKNAQEATDYGNIREIVVTTPGAIGIDPFGYATKSVNLPKVPLVTSPIIVITKGKPSAKVQKMIDFYKEEIAFLSK